MADDITKKKIENFQKLPYEKRLEIITTLIKTLKDKWNQSAIKIYNSLQYISHPSDELLETIYTEFEEGVEKNNQSQKEKNINAFTKSQELLKRIQEREAAEQEEDPDSLLEWL